jgi:hypothetical protein
MVIQDIINHHNIKNRLRIILIEENIRGEGHNQVVVEEITPNNEVAMTHFVTEASLYRLFETVKEYKIACRIDDTYSTSMITGCNITTSSNRSMKAFYLSTGDSVYVEKIVDPNNKDTYLGKTGEILTDLNSIFLAQLENDRESIISKLEKCKKEAGNRPIDVRSGYTNPFMENKHTDYFKIDYLINNSDILYDYNKKGSDVVSQPRQLYDYPSFSKDVESRFILPLANDIFNKIIYFSAIRDSIGFPEQATIKVILDNGNVFIPQFTSAELYNEFIKKSPAYGIKTLPQIYEPKGYGISTEEYLEHQKQINLLRRWHE